MRYFVVSSMCLRHKRSARVGVAVLDVLEQTSMAAMTGVGQLALARSVGLALDLGDRRGVDDVADHSDEHLHGPVARQLDDQGMEVLLELDAAYRVFDGGVGFFTRARRT